MENPILLSFAPWRYARLPLRATEGLAQSLVTLLELDLAIPDYTTLSRRQGALAVQIPRRAGGLPLHMVVDATGLSVSRQSPLERGPQRRTWRKVHLGVDEATSEIVAAM